jgi:hypothetical protein
MCLSVDAQARQGVLAMLPKSMSRSPVKELLLAAHVLAAVTPRTQLLTASHQAQPARRMERSASLASAYALLALGHLAADATSASRLSLALPPATVIVITALNA